MARSSLLKRDNLVRNRNVLGEWWGDQVATRPTVIGKLAQMLVNLATKLGTNRSGHVGSLCKCRVSFWGDISPVIL